MDQITDEDPLALWKLIKLTHLGATTGVLIRREFLALKNLLFLKQSTGRSLVFFKQDFDVLVETYKATAADPIKQPMLATMFIEALDPLKFSNFKTDLRNQAAPDAFDHAQPQDSTTV